MDSLSDDLLLRVLSFVDDAVALLDRLPLVCKRWRRLSRDPRAWASVSLDVPSYDDDWGSDDSCDSDEGDGGSDALSSDDGGSDAVSSDDGGSDALSSDDGHTRRDRDPTVRRLADFQHAARILLHAPALRRLKFNWTQMDAYCDRGLDTVMSALRRTRAAVREVAFHDVERDNVGGLHSGLSNTCEEHVEAMLGFLRADRDHLKVLHLQRVLNASSMFNEEEEDWWGVDDEDESSDPEDKPLSVKVAETLAELHQLEELSLYVDAKPKYQGGFLDNPGPPSLRRLKVMPHYNGYNPANVTGMVELMCSLLGGAAQSLQHVDFSHNHFPLREAVKAELSRCSQLRSLACNLADITAVRTMSQLRELRLVVNDEVQHYPHVHNLDNFPEPPFPELADLLAANTAFLRGCESLRGLRDLRLHVLRAPLFRKEVFRPHKDLMVGLFGALASAARHVTRLELDLSDLGVLQTEVAVNMVATMKDLQIVHLGRFHADLLPRLAGLRKLKEIYGYACAKEESKKGTIAKCIQDFKARRPDVRCHVKPSQVVCSV